MSARRDSPPRWTRSWRVLISALAGGGLTIAGLGGPLAGGAFGSEAGTGTTGPGNEPPASTTPESGTSTTGASTTSTPTTSTPAPTTTTTETTTTGSTTAPSTTAPATTPEPATPPASTSGQGKVEAPTVVVRRKQRSTPSKPSSSNVTTTGAGANGQGAGSSKQGSPGAEANAPNNVAPPPQLVAAQASALAALLDGSGQASAQSLNFYRIPLFLLPIYQAAAARYDVPWPILAAINEIETDYGMDLSVSSAGAEGWMQFEPGTWLQYGVDALNAGYADPYNPVDAIFAAARYLNAAGAAHNLSASIMAYNHSEAYVESVLLRAKLIAAYPGQVIATLTGMIDGRPPVTGKRIAWGAPVALPGSVPKAAAAGSTAGAAGAASQLPSTSTATAGATPLSTSASTGPAAQGSTATPGSTDAPAPAAAASAPTAPKTHRQGVDVASAPNARVVAVQDGRIIKLGYSRALGRYVVLQDIYGDVFTYAGLGGLAHSYTPPKADALGGAVSQNEESAGQRPGPLSGPSHTGAGKVRVFAHPGAGNQDARAAAASAKASAGIDGRQPLRAGSVIPEGTVLGRVGRPPNAKDGHLLFAIRPAGDSGTVDPRAILENWVQLDAALHPQGAKGNPSLLGATATDVLLLSKSQLERTVLADPGIALSACSRHEVASGAVDKRALAVLAFLSRSGLKPTVGTLRCGAYDAAGYVQSGHAGDAVAIVAINGIPITGHQGAGTITDTTIRTLLTLQDEYAPARIVSLMRYPGAISTLARADHGNYIEIVFPPALSRAVTLARAKSAAAGQAAGAKTVAPVPTAIAQALSPAQWEQLIGRVSALPAPSVAYKPSSTAIPDHPRAASK